MTERRPRLVPILRRAGVAREDLDHGISRLYAPGTASDYLIPTSCGRITSWRIVGKKKPRGYRGIIA
jgi:hypothetical protein